jgi:predicted pyridoxine 5'-phosphate oxidase superfamily flavin-nucleotide-binding protein
MGKLHPTIDDDMRAWLAAQRMFFVATAPSGDQGHVNCSPKGGEALAVVGPTTVAYLDRVGSGIETVAHVRQNGRIVVMFCAFEGPPRIVRLHGRGRSVLPGEPEFAALRAHFAGPDLGVRAIVLIDVHRISDSCGFGVPRYRYEGDREQMSKWCEKKGEDGVATYIREKNARSLDGLPGID